MAEAPVESEAAAQAPSAAVEEALPSAPRGAPRPSMRLARADAAPPTGRPSRAPGGEAATPGATERAPMLIYTAQLTLAIFDVAPSLKAVEALAREAGGFMASQTDQAITIRVPVARFAEALERVEKMGDVLHRNVQAQDITQEFLDIETRVKSARAVRERIEQLLARATKVDESIAIERELERIVGEIERMEGRLKYLRDRAQFSTISVQFSSRPKEVVAKGAFELPFPWLSELGLARLLNLGGRR